MGKERKGNMGHARHFHESAVSLPCLKRGNEAAVFTRRDEVARGKKNSRQAWHHNSTNMSQHVLFMCLLLAAAITGAPISENDIWNEKSDTEGVRRATKKTPAEAEEEHRKMKEHLVNNFKNSSWESPFGTPPPAKSDKLAPVSGSIPSPRRLP